ncbi:cell division protein FtsK [Motiliproteus sp. MSK22-1]|nr:cell division protein FtsK [Motiliproteus sp. MSK22-1]
MTATEREAFVSFVSRIVKEGGVIVLIGSCALLLLSLLTFDSRDPGWSHLGYDGIVRNLAGPGGAWLADFSYSAVGFLAFAPPLMLIYRAALFFRKRQQRLSAALAYFSLRMLGALVFIVAGSGIATLHFGNQWMELPFGAGGMLGLSVSSYALGLFGLIGASFLLLPLWLLGLTLFSDISWVRVADWLGMAVFSVVSRLMPNAKSAESFSVDSEYGRFDTGVDAPFINAETDVDADSQSEHPDKAAQSGRVSQFFERLTEQAQSVTKKEPSLNADFSIYSDGDPLSAGNDRQEYRVDDSSGLMQTTESVSQAANNEARSVEGVSAGPSLANRSSVDNKGQGTVSESVAPASATSHEKHVKIVPLSETVKPQASDDDLDGTPRRSSKSALSQLGRKRIPPLSLLDKPEDKKEQGYSPEVLEAMSRLLESKLKDFGVIAEVVEVNPGPVITRFEIQPAPGVKVSKISNLAKDLARSMAVLSVRVVEVIAGKSVVGIEIPNENREIVRLSEVLNAKVYGKAESKLSLALGNDIAGNPVVVNLAKMPHLLVAGTTGSGKSVGVNAMLLSLLFKATPDEVRLMMVDPKMLELSIYDGIPHLLTPVITDMKEAAAGLRWCVAEMERRYKLMAKLGVRNLAGFNDKLRTAQANGEPILDPLWNPLEEGFDEHAPAPELENLPFIVVVIDEFADMMMIVGKKVEELIARIAQKARAAGIHLILATQRPSVDVITGLIKANVPTRIAFQVSSKIDSRTILDQGGAENLLGYGDMLYLPAGTSVPVRVHGAFVADDEVHRLVDAWKKWGPANFVDNILASSADSDSGGMMGASFDDEQDPLYDEAVAFVTHSRRASISAVQRKLKIGYNRAARMVESMEAAGVVSEAGHNGSREVLAPPPVEM